MELVGALRTLWRFKFLVIANAVFAIAIGLFVAFSFSPPTSFTSRQYHVGLGTATALVDSPSSQIVDLGGAEGIGADIGTLSGRATLLASLMTSSPMKDEIAAKAGIDPRRLIAISPAVSPGAGGAPVVPDTKRRDIFVLRATIPSLESGQVPIISVSTQAPEPEQATKLADAAFAVLNQQVESTASTDNVPADRRLNVRQLGPAQAELEVRGPSKTMAAMAVIVVFGLGCGAILMFVALVRGWHAATEAERNPRPLPVADGYINGNGNGHGHVPHVAHVPHEPQTPHTPPAPVLVRAPAPAPAPAPVPERLAPRAPAADGSDETSKRNWASR